MPLSGAWVYVAQRGCRWCKPKMVVRKTYGYVTAILADMAWYCYLLRSLCLHLWDRSNSMLVYRVQMAMRDAEVCWRMGK